MAQSAGISLYGLAPPKLATPTERLRAISAQQAERIKSMNVDGVIVYDIQDEADRAQTPRPFPFLPTIDPELFANQYLDAVALPKVVYRCVSHDTPESFIKWLLSANEPSRPQISVLVGAPARRTHLALTLADAYSLARQHAPHRLLGGIAIAERHGARLDEHERLLAKADMGCRFFVTQAVYDVTTTKSLLSDYALTIRGPAVPIILTFAPCGSEKTLTFMQWLGISFPRWLENELRYAPDPLSTSIRLCESIFAEIWDYARDKGIPIGINVESISIRKAEIDASVELHRRLRLRMEEA